MRKIQTIIQRDIFMLKLKKLKKYVALGLSCLIAINTTTVTFAQNSTSNQEYESANNEVSNNVIINNSGVIINGTYYSIAEFESLLDHTILISETGNSSARIAAIGAGIPNLGKFKNKVKGKTSYKEEGGWAIDKDTAGHGGRKWKLKDKKGNRIASLGKNGEVLGK